MSAFGDIKEALKLQNEIDRSEELQKEGKKAFVALSKEECAKLGTRADLIKLRNLCAKMKSVL